MPDPWPTPIRHIQATVPVPGATSSPNKPIAQRAIVPTTRIRWSASRAASTGTRSETGSPTSSTSESMNPAVPELIPASRRMSGAHDAML